VVLVFYAYYLGVVLLQRKCNDILSESFQIGDSCLLPLAKIVTFHYYWNANPSDPDAMLSIILLFCKVTRSAGRFLFC